MTSLAVNLSLILTGIQAIIAPIASRDRARTEFLVRVWYHLNRTRLRFERLFARWQAGTLPKTRKRSPQPPAAQSPAPLLAAAGTPRPARFRLPRGFAWLRHQIPGHEINGRRSQFRHLLTTPELAAFLEAAPQAARLLNPLCRMLGATLCVTPAVTSPAAAAPQAAGCPSHPTTGRSPTPSPTPISTDALPSPPLFSSA